MGGWACPHGGNIVGMGLSPDQARIRGVQDHSRHDGQQDALCGYPLLRFRTYHPDCRPRHSSAFFLKWKARLVVCAALLAAQYHLSLCVLLFRTVTQRWGTCRDTQFDGRVHRCDSCMCFLQERPHDRAQGHRMRCGVSRHPRP